MSGVCIICYCSSVSYIPQVSSLVLPVTSGVRERFFFLSDNWLEVYKIHQFPSLT